MELDGVAEMRSPLLRCAAWCQAAGSPYAWKLASCCGYVVLSASSPLLIDLTKRHNGGSFPFRSPALVFHAYACGTLLGATSTLHASGLQGLHSLLRVDMLCRFGAAAVLLALGDSLNFLSAQHLDVATYTLVGKALAIVVTVLCTRAVLGQGQTRLQHLLVLAITVATAEFCRADLDARHGQGHQQIGSGDPPAAGRRVWWRGLSERTAGVGLVSLAAVLTQRLLTQQQGVPFLRQQFWMGCGAMCTSLLDLRLAHGLPIASLLEGFDNWRALLLLASFTASGLCGGLVVKHLGAVAKALCVPVYLGGCYIYAVQTGSAVFTVRALACWLTSVACILAFAFSKTPFFAKSSWNPARWGGGGKADGN